MAFIAGGSAATHCIVGDINGVCYTWGRNEVRSGGKVTLVQQVSLLCQPYANPAIASISSPVSEQEVPAEGPVGLVQLLQQQQAGTWGGTADPKKPVAP